LPASIHYIHSIEIYSRIISDGWIVLSSEKPSTGLVRSLSLTDATMVGIAAMIGGAILKLAQP